MDDTFAFNVGLQYEIIIQYHCIYAYDMRWNLDSYPECNAKVTVWHQSFGLFLLDNKWPKIYLILELEP